MPTPTWERLPEQRRQAVLRAAEAEFAEHGFSRSSLNVIARNAGVAKGSLFQYFAGKVDMYAHLSELASVRIRSAMEEHIPALPWEEDFFGSFRELAHLWVAYFDSHPLELALTAAVNLEPDNTVSSAVRRTVNRHYLAVLRPLVERGRAAGHLRADTDLDAMLALLLLMLPHLALAPRSPGLDPLLGLDSGDPRRVASAVDRLIDVLVAAFGAPRS